MISRFRASKTFYQTFWLFSAQIVGLAIGFFSNMILAKAMGVEGFGLYSFVFAVLSFLALFFEFGYFASAARLVAINQNEEEERELIGASLFLAGVIAVAFFITVILISLIIDSIFYDKIGAILRSSLLVNWVFILPFFADLILKGANRIEYLAAFHFLTKFLFFSTVLLLFWKAMVTPLNVLLCYNITMLFSFIWVFVKLKPIFKNLEDWFTKIHLETKRYGIHIYLGRVADVSAYQLDRLLIGYFSSSTEVGFYSLANSLASPINSLSNALASSKFKSFARASKIDRQILILNFAWIVLASFLSNIGGWCVIKYILGDDYNPVAGLLFVMSLAVSFQASYQPYNSWLNSNGFGKEMKYLNIRMAFFSCISNFILIFCFGSFGAAVASFLVMAYAFYLYYKVYEHKRRE